ALKNPLMDRGRMLADASHVLVHVAGGPAMTLSEVEILMQELGRHINDHTQILFGTSVDGRMGNRLSVTLISSLATEEEVESVPAKPVARSIEPEPIAKDEPVAPPAPPIWEQHDEPPAAAAEPPAFADELMQIEEPAVEIEPDPAPTAYEPEEPV